MLAKAAATLDKLSGGRFILGLGAGYQKSEFHALGVDMEERNALFDEALDVLPLHWRGEPFSYQGRHFNARDVIARPLPVQNPIPIWIGGNSRLSRKRAALKAQGWMPMAGGPTVSATARTPDLGTLDLAGAIADMRSEAAAAGRSEQIDVLHSWSGASVDNEHERHREALAKLEQAGITWVMVTCHTRERSATLEFIEAFGTTYL